MTTDTLEHYTSREIKLEWLLGWRGTIGDKLGTTTGVFIQKNGEYGIKELSGSEQFKPLTRPKIEEMYKAENTKDNRVAYFYVKEGNPLTNFLFKIESLTILKDYQVSKLFHQDIVFDQREDSFRGHIEVRKKSSGKISFVVSYQKEDYETICRQEDSRRKIVDSIRIDTITRRVATISEEMILKIINNQIRNVWFCDNNGMRINPLEMPRTRTDDEDWWDKVHKKRIRHKKKGTCYRLSYCGNSEMRGINKVGEKTPPHYIDTQQVLKAYHGHADDWEFVDDEGSVITNFAD